MAPPTPVYDRAYINSTFSAQLRDPEKFQCLKKSLIQNECTFKILYPGLKPEAVCLPFKREFLRCLIPTIELKGIHKVETPRWTNIELTDENTNRSLLNSSKYRVTVKEFLDADKELRRLIETEAGI